MKTQNAKPTKALKAKGFKKSPNRDGKYSDLKNTTKSGKYRPKSGALVFAVIGNYKGRGKQRVILHEAVLSLDEEGNPSFGYGVGKVWNFPTGKGRPASR